MVALTGHIIGGCEAGGCVAGGGAAGSGQGGVVGFQGGFQGQAIVGSSQIIALVIDNHLGGVINVFADRRICSPGILGIEILLHAVAGIQHCQERIQPHTQILLGLLQVLDGSCQNCSIRARQRSLGLSQSLLEMIPSRGRPVDARQIALLGGIVGLGSGDPLSQSCSQVCRTARIQPLRLSKGCHIGAVDGGKGVGIPVVIVQDQGVAAIDEPVAVAQRGQAVGHVLAAAAAVHILGIIAVGCGIAEIVALAFQSGAASADAL